MAEFDDEKTISATPHRRQQAREQGQVVLSQDLNSAAVVIFGLLILALLGGSLVRFLVQLVAYQLGGEAQLATDVQTLASDWVRLLLGLARVLLPILGLLLLATIALPLVQTRLLCLPGRLAPDLSRVNPWTGLRRLFSGASLVRLTLGVFKIAAIGGVAFYSLNRQRATILNLSALEPPQLASALWEITLWTSLKVGGALVALALLDYGYQWWRHEQDLRMTPDELREELRNLQGNPQVAARRRGARQRSASDRGANATRP